MSDPNLTQSHLLNRILQRQISRLESENTTLKARVARLESRVTESTARHRAISGSAADDVNRAAIESQSISRETERAAKLMVQQMQTYRAPLLEAAQRVQQEEARLAQAIAGFNSALENLPTQAKRNVAALIRTAHRQQEQLLAQLAALYDGEGVAQGPEGEMRLKARRAEEEAIATRQQLATQVEREQAALNGQVARAQEQAQRVAQRLAETSQSITELQSALRASVKAPETGAPARGAPAIAGRIAAEQEEKVLETARRAMAEEAAAPVSAFVAATPTHTAYDTDAMRLVGHDDGAIVSVRSRYLLPIGVLLVAFVVVMFMLMMPG